MMKLLKSLVLFVLIFGLSGCSTVNYYAQSAKGHLSLMSKQEPIDNFLQNPAVTAERKKELKQVKEILAFAHNTLKLPNNGSYTQFVELNREAVTWNLVVNPKYSMTPAQWCFPIVGCISYKGYFSKAKAEREAKKLVDVGYDVYLAESNAYSTLGWFKDPVVSTMLDNGVILTAETIFHELSHQRVYHKSDSNFNEAFASAVGREGTKLWLKTYYPDSLTAYAQHLEKQTQFIQLLLGTSKKLRRFYHVEQSRESLESGKQKILKELRQDYEKLKQSWGGDTRYDGWFKQPINNARLAIIGVYYQQIPQFVEQLKAHQYDFEAFYQTMDKKKAVSATKLSKAKD